MNIINILEKLSVESVQKGKNVSKGWTGVDCPFCFDAGFHGGFNNDNPRWYYCWKCGSHRAEEALSLLAGVSIFEAKAFLKDVEKGAITSDKKVKNKPFCLPLLCQRINQKHQKYLTSRNYDADFLEEKYSLQGTGEIGVYRNRIIAPIFLNKKIVSYQGRDITGKAKERYMACKTEREIVHHKHTLYNIDNCEEDFIFIFEGITSVWRWGDNTAATFGIMWKQQQAKMLLRFKKVFIFFDSDINARIQSQKLASFLSSFGIATIEINTENEKDPADLSEKEIKDIKKTLKIR